MSPSEIVGGVIILIASVIIVVTVMMQEGKNNGLNALSGGGGESSYLGKNKNRSMQATLARVTKVTGIVFVVVTLAVYFIVSAMAK